MTAVTVGSDVRTRSAVAATSSAPELSLTWVWATLAGASVLWFVALAALVLLFVR